MDAIARQPEAAGKIQTAMIIAAALKVLHFSQLLLR
jgi:F0F1-type ATP synthase membrane subunit c/vacuolar-type H+-ATPase subunit K